MFCNNCGSIIVNGTCPNCYATQPTAATSAQEESTGLYETPETMTADATYTEPNTIFATSDTAELAMPATREELERRLKAMPKWYSWYGLIFGILVWLGGESYFMSKLFTSEFHSEAELLHLLFLTLAPWVVSVVVCTCLNKFMLKRAGTVPLVIHGLSQGWYDADCKDVKTKQKVIKAISKGRTGTVTGALNYLQVVEAFGAFGKLAGIIFLPMLAIAWLASLLTGNPFKDQFDRR